MAKKDNTLNQQIKHKFIRNKINCMKQSEVVKELTIRRKMIWDKICKN